jgi:hypothetical protein
MTEANEILQENPATFQKILTKLNDLNISYTHTHHPPVKTSQEAADVRYKYITFFVWIDLYRIYLIV